MPARNVVGDQRGHANAEVDVEAVAQFAGDALDDAFALLGSLPGLVGIGMISSSLCTRLRPAGQPLRLRSRQATCGCP